jgi:hypothetical protein
VVAVSGISFLNVAFDVIEFLQKWPRKKKKKKRTPSKVDFLFLFFPVSSTQLSLEKM